MSSEEPAPVVDSLASSEGPTSVETNDAAAAVAAADRQRKHIEKSGSDEESDEGSEAAKNERIATNQQLDELDNSQRNRQELEEKLDKLIKKPKVRRNRRDEDDLEQFFDEEILRMKDEMNVAAQIDVDTLNRRLGTGDNSLIAMQKVKLLPKVENVLSKAHLADTILDNNLLQSVRIWLEPLPDGSLPSFEIQKSLFAALEKLPIKTEHLKESGLGRVIIFYTKSKRVEPPLARLADRLIAEWTRPIIGASDNYRDKRILQLEFDAEKMRKKSALDSAKSRKKKSGKKIASHGSTAQSLYEQAAARRNRAAAPAPTTTDYKYAPTSNLNPTSGPSKMAGVGSSLNNSEMYKRLTSRLQKNKRSK